MSEWIAHRETFHSDLKHEDGTNALGVGWRARRGEHKPLLDPLKRACFRRDDDTIEANDPANIVQQRRSVNPRKPCTSGLIRQTSAAARHACYRALAAPAGLMPL
ncbi:hypothetical protein [Trinickia mobilis]|uniref:hypothetical protein n=1 Tax=Trinickia mobilis TaxID=2816356 RepID=UPI001A8CC859|nr:hypothetical protein [Trinickia mobilis]